MSKTSLYREAKQLAANLDYDVDKLRKQWRGSTIQTWIGIIDDFTTRIRERDASRNKALKLVRRHRIPLRLPNFLYGTSDIQWLDELNRIKRVLEKNPKVVKGIRRRNKRLIPLLTQIRNRPIKDTPAIIRSRTIARNQTIRQELSNIFNFTPEQILFNNRLQQNQFQTIVDGAILRNEILTLDQANRLFTSIIIDGRYTMNLEGVGRNRTYMIHASIRDFFIHVVTNGLVANQNETFESDSLNEFDITQISRIVLTKLQQPQRVINNRNGRFFPYINTTTIDLSRYQIFIQSQARNRRLMADREHCLIHSFRMAGVEEVYINEVMLSYEMASNISKRSLNDISNIIHRTIVLRQIGSDGTVHKQTFTPSTSTATIELAIHSNHYFIHEKSEYSRFFINNYEVVKDMEGAQNFSKRGCRGVYETGGAKATSLRVVDFLFQADHFKVLDMINFQETSSTKKLKDHFNLSNMDNEQQPVPEYKKPSNSSRPKVFYADCESYVHDNENDNTTPIEHKLQMIGLVNSRDDYVSVFNVSDRVFTETDQYTSEELVVLELLRHVTKNNKQNALVYFHNWKYDYHLIEKYLNIRTKCEKDNQIYNTTVKYRSCTIEFRDSYKLIPFGLAKFQKEFNLPKKFAKKEAIAYKYYTKANHNVRIKSEAYRELLSVGDRPAFDRNMRTEQSYNCSENTFNPTEYYKTYLRLDCLALKKGVEKFASMIETITSEASDDNIGMNIFDCLTISSLTDKFMIRNDCYKDVFEVKGNLRNYISKAVYGGRVCVNQRYVKQTLVGNYQDYDGVSLYPSSINRFCRETGLPIGKAKRIMPDDLNNWEENTHSILTVRILNVNRNQQMPFIATKNEFSIDYSNTPPTEPIIIDNITLRDYIDFHEIEYEVLDGICWDEGGNRKMGAMIKKLFNKRVEYKRTNKALANVIKLMLNSSYGKTIMKKVKTETKIVQLKKPHPNQPASELNDANIKFNNYIYSNFATIKSYRKINDRVCEVQHICSDNTYNRGHIGAAILSMSKRIMNEVFDIADRNQLPIYYTDTDSLHCNTNDVPKLEEAYYSQYGKQLNGVELEQFHTDFDLDGAAGEIYATKSIFLGKKSYLDVLESVDSEGKTINGYHIRMKGVTSEGLLHASKNYENGYLGLYEDLASGTEIAMTLNPFNIETNQEKVLFQFKSGRVSTRREFIRTVKF
jgi:hypothetical protein